MQQDKVKDNMVCVQSCSNVICKVHAQYLVSQCSDSEDITHALHVKFNETTCISSVNCHLKGHINMGNRSFKGHTYNICVHLAVALFIDQFCAGVAGKQYSSSIFTSSFHIVGECCT